MEPDKPWWHMNVLAAQFKEYLDRAEFVKGILDGQIPAETTTSNGAVGQKARPPGGGDKDVSPPTACCIVPAAMNLLCMSPWLPHVCMRPSAAALAHSNSNV